ncbi:MAG: hypothetical protein CMJ78_27210 [Planctomycetaceae bacterium]|nr:hypothetical protein [Planctomycetaceae bacterium]
MKRKLLVVTVGFFAFIVIGDFIYSQYVLYRWRQWEAGIVRDEDGIREGCRPFYVGPRSSNTAILMVHGFSDSPPIFRTMAERLAKSGFRCRVMRVPGFSTHLTIHAKLTTAEWRSAIDREVRTLRKRHQRVVIIGHSLGGALTIRHILEHPESADAVVLLAPLLAVSDERAPVLSSRSWYEAAGFALNFTTVIQNTYPIDGYSDEARDFAYREVFVPRRIYDNLFEILDSVEGRAGEIQTPLLMAVSNQDHVINWKVDEEFFEDLRSKPKKLIWQNEAGHAIPLDTGWRELTDEIVEFIGQSE